MVPFFLRFSDSDLEVKVMDLEEMFGFSLDGTHLNFNVERPSVNHAGKLCCPVTALIGSRNYTCFMTVGLCTDCVASFSVAVVKGFGMGAA